MDRHLKYIFAVGATAFILVMHSCTYEIAELEKTEPKPATVIDTTVSFSVTILPLINSQCVDCHSPGGVGEGDFTSYEGILLKVENGSLRNRVINMMDMPTPGSGYELTNAEREKFSSWLDQGAPNN
jgi:uncharacterized membrane protein